MIAVYNQKKVAALHERGMEHGAGVRSRRPASGRSRATGTPKVCGDGLKQIRTQGGFWIGERFLAFVPYRLALTSATPSTGPQDLRRHAGDSAAGGRERRVRGVRDGWQLIQDPLK